MSALGLARRVLTTGEIKPGSFTDKFKKTVGMTPKSLAWQTSIFAGMDVVGNQESMGTAVAKGAVETLAWHAFPIPMTGYMLGQAAFAGITASIGRVEANGRAWNRQHINNTLGGSYMDTQHAQYMRQAGIQAIQQSSGLYTGALTQRQAAVQAIAGSKLNARSALGTEAKLLHIPY